METKTTNTGSIERILIFACIALLPSCVDHHFGPAVPVSGDYFPMSKGSWWEYVRKYPCPWPDTTNICYDTIFYTSGGDFFGNSEAYQPLSTHYGTFRWIRKTGDCYYAMGAYLPEYKFLDTSLPVNGSWVVGDDYSYSMGWEEFTIMEVNAEKSILDVTYQNVIVVRHSVVWKHDNLPPEVVRNSYHYYAKDVGEIYRYLAPNPDRNLDAFEEFLNRFEIH